jgi:hypothetical protein
VYSTGRAPSPRETKAVKAQTMRQKPGWTLKPPSPSWPGEALISLLTRRRPTVTERRFGCPRQPFPIQPAQRQALLADQPLVGGGRESDRESAYEDQRRVPPRLPRPPATPTAGSRPANRRIAGAERYAVWQHRPRGAMRFAKHGQPPCAPWFRRREIIPRVPAAFYGKALDTNITSIKGSAT